MILSRSALHRLLRTMLRIRKLQLRIEDCYLENEMKTPVHLYIGQEAIATGTCAHLGNEDYISSNHRSHGHYLAKGGNLRALVAELYCKETGCSKGRGGSMHVVDTSVGHLGSSAIVGGGIPLGTGFGLALKMQGKPNVSVVFFGDGAADEGVLYESINFAVLKKLPVVFVLENNQYSVCSHVSARQACDNVFHHMPQEHLFTGRIDGNDIMAVHRVTGAAVARARAGQGPSFIECRTYRMRGHAGCPSQDFTGYRDACEVESWAGQCPIARFSQELCAAEMITAEEIAAMEREIDAEIDEAFEAAKRDPLPAADGLHRHLFCER